MRFDLQSHSNASDGALEPADVVARAAQAGVELLALSDHDTVDGIPAAAAAARDHGIKLTPAAEISAVDGAHEDLHVVGYELRTDDPDLLATLHDWRGDRERRVLGMVDRMRELGFELDTAVLDERRAAGLPLGRPHLADAILAHPANAARLRDESIEGKNQLFPAYLVPGAPGYVFRTVPTVTDAIDVIHAAGGVAIWAHPFWDLDDAQTTLEAIDRFQAHGLDGVEVFYPTHSEEQTRLLHAACTERGLLITGSSDFHAPDHERFGRFLSYETHGLEPALGPIGGD